MLSEAQISGCTDETIPTQDHLILQSTPTFSLMRDMEQAYSKQYERLEAVKFLQQENAMGRCVFAESPWRLCDGVSSQERP